MAKLEPLRSTVQDDAGALAIITTVAVVVIWFAGATPDMTTRVISTVLAGLLAFAGAVLGLWLIES